MEMQMKSINTKLVLSALGIVAMLAGPAYAKTARAMHNQATSSQTIPGYAADGSVVPIQDPDQR
jgi:hypothetical protein